MINFNLNNASCFGITNKKVELQIKIKLKDIILLGNKLGFYYLYIFFKQLTIQIIEVRKNILAISIAL